MTEDEIVGQYHQLNEHEFDQALGDGEGQGSLACCTPWGHKESDATEQLNNSNKSSLSLSFRVLHLCKDILPFRIALLNEVIYVPTYPAEYLTFSRDSIIRVPTFLDTFTL